MTDVLQCRICGEFKPATADYWRVGAKYKTGWIPKCKACLCRSKTKAGVPAGMKRCTACSTIKPATTEFFPREAKNRDGIAARCKPCHAERQKGLRAAEPDKYRAVQKRFYAKNPDADSRYKKKARATKGDRVRELNRLSNERWRQKDPERYTLLRRTRQLVRRARFRQAEGAFTADDVKQLLVQQGNKCFWCEEALSKYHVDHFIPLSRGGTNYVQNLVCACPFCNTSRNNKMPWEWMPDRFSPPEQQAAD